MAFSNAQKSRAYIGVLRASAYTRTLNGTSSTDVLETTVNEDTEKQFIPNMTGGAFSCGGPLDSDPTAQSDAISDIKAATTPTPVTFLPFGDDVDAAWLIEVDETQFDVSTGVGQTVDWAFTGQATGETDFNGVTLDNATITADTDSSSTDNAAQTTNGAVAHLHVTAYSGLTSDDIIIEGSATGSFSGEETTVVTFTQVTGTTSERVEVTGTVHRYLRVADDVTGTGSITRHVSIARR